MGVDPNQNVSGLEHGGLGGVKGGTLRNQFLEVSEPDGPTRLVAAGSRSMHPPARTTEHLHGERIEIGHPGQPQPAAMRYPIAR